jgi:hypothetical protein
MGGVKVRLTEDNTLRAFNREWVEVGPLTFQEKFGDATLHFREGENGEITHMFRGGVPIVAYERIPLTESPILHYVLFALTAAFMAATLMALPWGWAARRWYGVRAEELVRFPRRARLTLWWAAFSHLLFLVGLVISLANPNVITEEITLVLRVALLIPFLGGLLSLGSLFFALRAFQLRQGRAIARVFYSGAALFFSIFIWQLHVWNLIGWRF